MAPSMNSVHLIRPAAGQSLVLGVQAEHLNLSLDFPTDEVVLRRTGDDLEFIFDDGASIMLQAFYKAYNSTTIPDFEVQGKLVTGTEFFTALGEEFMPAAGLAKAVLNTGGRFHDEGNMSLLGGIDSLGGLDVSTVATTQTSTVGANKASTALPTNALGPLTRSTLSTEGNIAPTTPTPEIKEDVASPPSDGVLPPSAPSEPAHEHDHSYNEVSGGSYTAWNSHSTSVTGQESFVFTSIPVGTSQFGTFNLEKGALTFSPDATVVNKLGPGQQITESFTTVDVNGQSHTITLTFNGSNANDDTLTVVDFTAGTVSATNAVGGSTPFTITPDSDGNIHLGAGNDQIFVTGTMSGGTLLGDAGNDLFWVNTMSGGNIIDMSADGSTGSSATVLTMGSDATLTTGAGSDAITLGYFQGSIDTGTGDDSITIGTVGDGASLTCLGSKNVITIGSFELGATLTLSGSGSILYHGYLYNFDDLKNAPITISKIGDTLVGTGAMIVREASSLQDNLTNTITGNGTDTFYDGKGGNDVIIGSGANETIMGGAGNNILRGGKGDDILWGHGHSGQEGTASSPIGNNIFVWDANDYDKGTDSIKDFELGKDWIYLGGNVTYSIEGASLKILDTTGTLLQTITLTGTGIANADPNLWLLTGHETDPGKKGLAQLAEEAAKIPSPASITSTLSQEAAHESSYGTADFTPNMSLDLADSVALQIIVTTAA